MTDICPLIELFFAWICSTKVTTKAQVQTRAQRVVVAAQMDTRQKMVSLAAAALTIALVPGAKADLTSDLLAKSTANAELHNKQRLATSYANFARSRTVTDGTCKFPGVSILFG